MNLMKLKKVDDTSKALPFKIYLQEDHKIDALIKFILFSLPR